MLPRSLLRRAPRLRPNVDGVLALAQQQVRLPLAAPAAQAASVSFSTSGSLSSSSSAGRLDDDVFAPVNVLSKANRGDCLRRLSRIPSLRPPSTPSSGDTQVKEAAVLVPLCIVDDDLHILFTLRSPHMSSHRGQVSFPGGMKDNDDDSHETTALREMEEELGLSRDRVELWGRCPAMESVNRITAVPVIGFLGQVNVGEVKFNPKEVGEVFTMSLRHLCDKRNFRFTQFRTGKGYSIPVFLGGKYRIWGLTAGITHIFLSALMPAIYKNKIYYNKPLKI